MSDQVRLDLEVPVDIETVERQKTLGEAFELSRQLAGLDRKQAYPEIGITTRSVMSDIESNACSFPMRGDLSELIAWRNTVKNDVPLIWIVSRLGFEPRSLRLKASALEIENAELRRQIDEMQRKQETIEEFVRRTGAGR